MKNSISLICFLSFVAGVTLTNVVWAANTVLEFFFVGVPVVCRDSFPRYHTACVYSRPGFGEQAITFEIDGKSVFHTDDFPGGDLNEDVFWDPGARTVTFHVEGLGDRTFDADSKIQIPRQNDRYESTKE